MMRFLLLFFSLFVWFSSHSQESLSNLLNRSNTRSVPYISVQEAKMLQHHNNPIFLDTREEDEYSVSHIKNAIFVGYNTFNLDNLLKQVPNKNSTIIVYCSLSIRSEDIGEKLLKAGYTNVKNLYGGIFEWKNNDYDIYNNTMKTDSIHAFSKNWGKWLNNGIKVYNINPKK